MFCFLKFQSSALRDKSKAIEIASQAVATPQSYNSSIDTGFLSVAAHSASSPRLPTEHISVRNQKLDNRKAWEQGYCTCPYKDINLCTAALGY